jgi:hypothetical protein
LFNNAELTGVSASVAAAFVASLACVNGKMGTRNFSDETVKSGLKSGMYAKSMVELSLMALRLRLVLKCLTGLPVSLASGIGKVADAGRRGALERLTGGLSDVRMEEKVVAPVMDRGRVVILEVEVRALMARTETRAEDMAVICMGILCDVAGCKISVEEAAVESDEKNNSGSGCG